MLYHYQVNNGIPKAVQDLTKGVVYPIYTKHALKQAHLKHINLPYTLNLSSCSIIEAEIIDNVVTKVVVRQPKYKGNDDLVLAIIPRGWVVKTAWYNKSTDNHKTLDKGRYA